MGDIAVTTSGPLLDGLASAIARELVTTITDRCAAFAIEAVHRHLNASIRNPTPYYETQITITTTAYTERSVNDRGVVYGPWLEGTSSRNHSTRFKGYASFRRAADDTQRGIGRVVGPLVATAVHRMGGVSV